MASLLGNGPKPFRELLAVQIPDQPVAICDRSNRLPIVTG